MKLKNLNYPLLKKAIDLYVARAYPAKIIPERLLGILELRGLEKKSGWKDVVQWPEWERTPPKAGPAEVTRLQLRLGNASYPHMKLSLDRISDTDEFIWSVDTHDQKVIELGGGTEKYKKLQEENQRFRQEIEADWTAAGISTQKSYCEEITEQTPPPARISENAARALLIDDDDEILCLERVLLEHEGFRVFTAKSSAEAVQVFEQSKPFDICLVDVMMQDRTGVDLLKELRTRHGLNCPVAFITAMIDPPVKPEPNLAVIKKPFDSRELLKTVHDLMEGSRDQRAG